MDDLSIVRGEYFHYLCNLMRIDLPEHEMYKRLMSELYDIDFFWVLPMDENRDIDALSLRRRFFNEYGIDICMLNSFPRSVLEVLCAFSERIECDVMGEPGEEEIEKWFWIMLDNLGLDRFDDDHFVPRIVRYKIDIWLNRKFKSNGSGGIFPLKNGKNDQKKVDMWYQMQNYLNENYPI